MRATIKRAFLVASVILSVGAAGRAAAATTTSTYVCWPTANHQITAITWDGNALYLDCDGTSFRNGHPIRFYAALSGDSCSGALPSLDTIKFWESLATDALLTGRPLTITWSQTDDSPRCGWTYLNSGDGNNYYYIKSMVIKPE